MLILVFALLLLGLLVGGVLLTRYGLKQNDDLTVLGVLVLVCGLVGSIALLATGIVIPLGNLGRAASLEAFYHANAKNYAAAVEETENVLTVSLEQFEALIPVQGSIEKLDVGETVSSRIVEWRDAVNAYNTGLKRFQAYDRNIWVGVYYPTLSEELKPIVIGP